MSDFLGRLVQRSLPAGDRPGGRSELAPRLPSLFEPPGADLRVTEADQEREAVQLSRTEEPRPPQEGESWSRTIIPSLQGAPVLPRAEASAPEPLGLTAPPADNEGSTPALPDTSGAPQAIQTRILRHEPAPAAAPDAEQGSVSAALPTLLPLSGSALLTNRQDRRVENAAALVDRSAGRTVHINIGRIEVRAVNPPQVPSPPRKTLPQTRLTIEEYLKQRNEGKR